jgi:ribosome assembly protein YihI (activator of Der GTPase)
MKERPGGRSESSGRRPFESSPQVGDLAELDERLELRERLVAVLDELDCGDVLKAAANLELLLADLDRAMA